MLELLLRELEPSSAASDPLLFPLLSIAERGFKCDPPPPRGARTRQGTAASSRRTLTPRGPGVIARRLAIAATRRSDGRPVRGLLRCLSPAPGDSCPIGEERAKRRRVCRREALPVVVEVDEDVALIRPCARCDRPSRVARPLIVPAPTPPWRRRMRSPRSARGAERAPLGPSAFRGDARATNGDRRRIVQLVSETVDRMAWPDSDVGGFAAV